MTKLALITGASKGLGRTLSEFLAGMGYDLILTARKAEPLEARASTLRGLGVNVDAVVGDISDPDHRRELLKAAPALDLLINNASKLGPSPLPSLTKLPLVELRRIHEVNFMAPLALIQLLLPALRARRGWIINISSDAAVGAYPGWGGYGSSKAALDLATRTLANELGGEHITVMAVDPGDMQTEMHQRAFPGEDISDRADPEETLPFWAWLLSQDPRSLNGARLEAQATSWELGLQVLT